MSNSFHIKQFKSTLTFSAEVICLKLSNLRVKKYQIDGLTIKV
jgi:hypothetical protein